MSTDLEKKRIRYGITKRDEHTQEESWSVALVQREPKGWTIKLEQQIIFIPLSMTYIQNLTALNREPEQLCGDHLTIEDKVASSSFADGMISQHLLSTLLTRAPEVLLEASSACLESEN